MNYKPFIERGKRIQALRASFTDANMKRLKELQAKAEWRDNDHDFVIRCQPALLNRLEAAENGLKHHQVLNGGCVCPYCAAWREARGE